jgi:hypothetical protein
VIVHACSRGFEPRLVECLDDAQPNERSSTLHIGPKSVTAGFCTWNPHPPGPNSVAWASVAWAETLWGANYSCRACASTIFKRDSDRSVHVVGP